MTLLLKSMDSVSIEVEDSPTYAVSEPELRTHCLMQRQM